MQWHAPSSGQHYETVSRAIHFIRTHAHEQPPLKRIAAAVDLSPFHLQRLFSEWAGISPKRFLQVLTKEYARHQLQKSASVLEAAEATGLSSTSRMHDLMVTCEAMTPGEIRAQGAGLDITWGMARSPFGDALIATTPRGVCQFAFCADDAPSLHAQWAALWPEAHWQRDDCHAAQWMVRIFPAIPTRGQVHLVLRGTNFQVKVWEALIRTEPGRVLSYQQLAGCVGSPRAARAVGTAMAANRIGFLIPCHRVIRDTGDIGQYRWGSDRKAAILAWEAARTGA